MRAQLDSPKKNRLVRRVQNGSSLRQAAVAEDISYTTAQNIMAKYRATGSTRNLPRSGRPPKVNERDVRRLVRIARLNRRIPNSELGKMVTPNISATTVARILEKQGYYRRKAAKIPSLTRQHKEARKKWARKVLRMTPVDWSHVIWSDEAYILLDEKKGTTHVTRRVDEAAREDCLRSTSKKSGICIMVWVCIMHNKKGPLVVLEDSGGKGGGMNSERYQEQVLEAVLDKFYTDMQWIRGRARFQQDGASWHTSTSTKEWLRRNEIELFPHPAGSPDMNPMVPLWSTLQKHIKQLKRRPTSKESLKQALKQAWNNISLEEINAHTGKMQERVKYLLKAKGGYTPF